MYIDSSVIVAILFEESARHKCLAILNKATEVMSSSLLEAEVLSVVRREGVGKKTAMSLLNRISLFQPDRLLSIEFSRIFSLGYCKGADAFHLASALYIDPSAEELSFFTLDKQQFQLATRLGFKCLF